MYRCLVLIGVCVAVVSATQCCSKDPCAPNLPRCSNTCCSVAPCTGGLPVCAGAAAPKGPLSPAKIVSSVNHPQWQWSDGGCVCGSAGCNAAKCKTGIKVEAEDRNANCCSQQPCGQRPVCPPQGEWEADTKTCPCEEHVMVGQMTHAECPCAQKVDADEAHCCRTDPCNGKVRCAAKPAKNALQP